MQSKSKGIQRMKTKKTNNEQRNVRIIFMEDYYYELTTICVFYVLRIPFDDMFYLDENQLTDWAYWALSIQHSAFGLFSLCNTIVTNKAYNNCHTNRTHFISFSITTSSLSFDFPCFLFQILNSPICLLCTAIDLFCEFIQWNEMTFKRLF